MVDSNDPRITITGKSSAKGSHRLSTKMLITQTDILTENSENLSEIDEELNLKNFDGKLDQHFMSETLDQGEEEKHIINLG